MSDAGQPSLVGFGLANYRSFGEEGFVVGDIRKINVFIGKNNSGKSNILRAIRLLKRVTGPRMQQGGKIDGSGLALKRDIDSHGRNGKPPTVTVRLPVESVINPDDRMCRRWHEASRDGIELCWNSETGGHAPIRLDPLDDDDLIRLHQHLTQSRYGGRPQRKQVLSDVAEPLLQRAVQALRTFDRLISVENFREIRRSKDVQPEKDTFNGLNVIDTLRDMQHPVIGQEERQKVFNRIVAFVRGLLGEPNLILEIPVNADAIYISMHGGRMPLASYGTGVHQLVILCAALAMHDDHVVCIEEPEIHMHPEMQRKFLRFIADETNNRYFITTHSNVFLDFEGDVVIYHVTHDGEKSSVTHVEATGRAREVLADLGYKASDLLQANCLLWVEGPSDRIFINRWLSLIAPELVEGIHYAITFYGGKILAHFAAVDEPADDLVEVLRINKHAIFVMDRDAVKADGRLNATKERVRSEIGGDQCWITQGREIENYLRPELIKDYLSAKFGKSVSATYNRNTRFDRAILKATKSLDSPTVDYGRAKVAYAREFCELMTDLDLDVLDLRERLSTVVTFIKRWNHIHSDDSSNSEP